MSSGCCPWIRSGKKQSSESDPDEYEYGYKSGDWITTQNGEILLPAKRTNSNSQATSSQAAAQSTSGQNKKSPNATSSPNTKNFEEECLKTHNRLRGLHGCPPLKLNPTISAVAKKWAINLANRDTMEHSGNDKYGENLYVCGGKTITGSEPAQAWYNEIKDYNFQKATFSMQTGHFTQLIWKETKELGIGVEVRGQKTWVVANYDPPGNVVGAFKENVPNLLKP